MVEKLLFLVQENCLLKMTYLLILILRISWSFLYSFIRLFLYFSLWFFTIELIKARIFHFFLPQFQLHNFISTSIGKTVINIIRFYSFHHNIVLIIGIFSLQRMIVTIFQLLQDYLSLMNFSFYLCYSFFVGYYHFHKKFCWKQGLSLFLFIYHKFLPLFFPFLYHLVRLVQEQLNLFFIFRRFLLVCGYTQYLFVDRGNLAQGLVLILHKFIL